MLAILDPVSVVSIKVCTISSSHKTLQNLLHSDRNRRNWQQLFFGLPNITQKTLCCCFSVARVFILKSTILQTKNFFLFQILYCLSILFCPSLFCKNLDAYTTQNHLCLSVVDFRILKSHGSSYETSSQKVQVVLSGFQEIIPPLFSFFPSPFLLKFEK